MPEEICIQMSRRHRNGALDYNSARWRQNRGEIRAIAGAIRPSGGDKGVDVILPDRATSDYVPRLKSTDGDHGPDSEIAIRSDRRR
jgi:hypothetical protein